MKLRIRHKILAALLLLSVIIFIVLGLLNLFYMNKLGLFALEASSRLGNSAVADSKKVLVARAEKEIIDLAKDQAVITNMNLLRITSSILAATRLYAELTSHNSVFEDVIWHQISRNKPDDGMAFSYYSLAPGVKEESIMPEMKSVSRMNNVFKFICANNSSIQNIYIATTSGIFFVYPWSAAPGGFDARKRKWFLNTIQSDGMVWTGPYASASNNKLVLTCSKAVPGLDGKAIAAIGIDINIEVIYNEFITNQIERNGHAFLIDEKGNAIAKENFNDVFLDWKDEFNSINILNSKNPDIRRLGTEMIAGHSGIMKCDLQDKGTYYTAYAPVNIANWSIGIGIPEEDILSSTSKMEQEISGESTKSSYFIADKITESKYLYMLICVAIIPFIIWAGLMVSGRITEPVRTLEAGAARIGGGDLNYKISVHTGDEIEELADTFNKMSDNLKIYIKNLQQVTAARERMAEELKVASDIQTSMLPRIFPPFPDIKQIDINAMMIPAKEVGGDFYDFCFIDPAKTKLFFCIGDVSGKGIPAALFMVMVKTLLKASALSGMSPSEILRTVNNAIEQDNDSCMFATVLCGIIDLQTGLIRMSNAGHNPPIAGRVPDGLSYLSIPPGIVLGPLLAGEKSFSEFDLKLSPGSIIFLYTDGITEAMNPLNEMFTTGRLIAELTKAPEYSSTAELINMVKVSTNLHAGGEDQFDDMTILAIRFNG
ncbi:MAG: hypothetical protein A2020_15775 [Lentisphaerae bacterium GWF2_45_14]|nr:MAG: hypothetical protein A2020_15775 [Lentisphaerae bacterium GWF2_45_14]